ncbi:MAG: aminotransferase class I/II-fold pyridoxal phosphate-dependent enzyme [Acidimicrobiia bacterium]|jgi:7-keto-8-aminopelargonate synthetase-like enzyme
MTESTVPTTSARAADRFIDHSRLGAELGFSHQLIEDEKFRGDMISISGRELANFGLSSYLGLSDDPRLKDAAIDAISRYGNAYSSSIAYTALPLYGELRDRLGAMFEAPVVIAGTTTLAHMAALPTIVRRGDLVLVDTLAHASIQFVLPALRAQGAEVRRVPHNDLDRVATRLEATSQRVWYFIDGLYSMHGDTAPAEEIRQLLEAHDNFWVYCDDAHSLGWSGTTGRGQFLERSGWHERLVMAFGLSKSFGSLGGVVAAADASVIDNIGLAGGPLVFGGPLPPASLAAGIASADIHLSDELGVLQGELYERIHLVNSYSRQIGLPLSSYEETPLWFVELGGAMTTASAAARLRHDGFFLNVAVHPVVPRGRAGVRFTVTRHNSMQQIGEMLDSLHATWSRYRGREDVLDLSAFED